MYRKKGKNPNMFYAIQFNLVSIYTSIFLILMTEYVF